MIKGYTLIEILIAIVVVSAISVATTNILFDTVVSRGKHYSQSGSSSEARLLVNNISKSVQSAKAVAIPSGSTLEIRDTVCKTIRLNTATQKLESATDNSASCTPPTSGFTQITSENITITKFNLTPISPLTDTVNLELEGIYKNSNSDHSFAYNTTIHARVGL